jgi:hypothetical protein
MLREPVYRNLPFDDKAKVTGSSLRPSRRCSFLKCLAGGGGGGEARTRTTHWWQSPALCVPLQEGQVGNQETPHNEFFLLLEGGGLYTARFVFWVEGAYTQQGRAHIRCLHPDAVPGAVQRPSSAAARPPPQLGPSSRRPRSSAGSAPLTQPLCCRSTRPTSPPCPAPQPPSSSPPLREICVPDPPLP